MRSSARHCAFSQCFAGWKAQARVFPPRRFWSYIPFSIFVREMASLTVSPGLSTTDFYALRAIVVRGMDRHIDVIAGAARFQRIVHENPDRIDQFKFTRPAAAHGIRNMKMNRHPLLAAWQCLWYKRAASSLFSRRSSEEGRRLSCNSLV